MNLEPTVLKKFVFDWEMCFRLCEGLPFSEFRRFGIREDSIIDFGTPNVNLTYGVGGGGV